MRSLRTPIAAVAIAQIVLGLLVARAYVDSHHTLYNNRRWTSTKTTLDGGIIGAQSFVFNLQTLAGGRLDLSAWFAHQEVVSNDEFDPRSVEVELSISRDADLTVQFGRSEHRYTGLRLSSSERFPPALLLATPEGEFLKKQEFRQLRRARPGRIHRLRIDFDDGPGERFTVYLNDQRLKSFRRPVARPMRIGFRGGARPALVHSVRVTDRDGGVWLEEFERPANWRLAYALSVSGVLLSSLLLFLILRRVIAVSDRRLILHFLMFSIVLLVVAALFIAFVWRRSTFYPNATERLEQRQAAYADAGAERMLERIRNEASPDPAPGIQRLLFIGSSQTRGSGATDAEHTLVRQTERLLNARAGTRRFECLNVAVRAYKMRHMSTDFQQHWVDSGATLAIVNAGYNDRRTEPEVWQRSLRALIAAAEEAGIQLVLIPEATSVVRPWPALERMHRSVRQTGARAGLPVIEMQSHLRQRADDGFLWWDWVHLTSFGQRVFAERLVDELVRLGLVQPDVAG